MTHVGLIPPDIGYGRVKCPKCGQVVPRYCMGGMCAHLRPDGKDCHQEHGVPVTTDDLWALLDAQRENYERVSEQVRKALL